MEVQAFEQFFLALYREIGIFYIDWLLIAHDMNAMFYSLAFSIKYSNFLFFSKVHFVFIFRERFTEIDLLCFSFCINFETLFVKQLIIVSQTFCARFSQKGE
jgi:hypothetical protein